MNKKVLSMLLSAAAIVTVQARHLTPDEALSRVMSQSQPQQAGKLAPAAVQSADLVYSAEINREPMAYVFTNAGNEGFIVVSADDVAMPLLGYSDNTVFDPENIPVNLKAWLDGYARQIAYATNNSTFAGTSTTAAAPRTDHAAVAPKITTTWNQDAPYWNDCPTLNGSRCYTGCVATAMAQVMNYHKWPEKPKGNITYSWYYNNNQKLSCNFDEMTFEWDKMLDNYTANSPAENCAAVAQLMKACGYASKMQYTPYASGTTGYSAAQGMVTYFNYDSSLTIQSRDWYNAEEWENLVYTELTTNGPVYYDGTGSDGGHAFVCDGYRSEGYFHFNWGWGGLSDGYFLLDALNPGSQGAGGNTTGFNYSQSIMQNLSKPKSNSTPVAILATNGGFTTSTTSTTLGRSVTFTSVSSNGGFFSYSVLPVSNVTIGVKYVNKETAAVNYITSYYANLSIEPLSGFRSFALTLPYFLSDGTFTVTPAYRVGDGEWQDMKSEPSYNNALTMTVSGSSVTFAQVGAEAKITAKDIKINGGITIGGVFSITVTMTNTGTRDFNGLVEARFLKSDGSVVASGEAYMLSITAGETMSNLLYQSEITSGALTEGKCTMAFYSSTSQTYLNEPIEVNVFEEPKMTCTKFVIGNQNSINCNDVRARATVTCSTLGYSGPIAFIAYQDDALQTPIGMFATEEQTFSAGESRSVTVSGIFQEGKVGESYIGILAFLGRDGQYHQIGSATVRFKVSLASGIDDVLADGRLSAAVIYPNPAESVATMEAPAEIQSVAIYSLSGTLLKTDAAIDGQRATLNVSGMPAGTYIVVATGTNAARFTAKLIKR